MCFRHHFKRIDFSSAANSYSIWTHIWVLKLRQNTLHICLIQQEKFYNNAIKEIDTWGLKLFLATFNSISLAYIYLFKVILSVLLEQLNVFYYSCGWWWNNDFYEHFKCKGIFPVDRLWLFHAYFHLNMSSVIEYVSWNCLWSEGSLVRTQFVDITSSCEIH